MAPLAAIIVAVPTSKTCRMCGALPARYAAIAAVIDSGYVPLKEGTTLYSFWLALNLLARSFTLSPSAPPMECHHWISVCAYAPDAAKANASAATMVSRIIVVSSGLLCGNGTSASRQRSHHQDLVGRRQRTRNRGRELAVHEDAE